LFEAAIRDGRARNTIAWMTSARARTQLQAWRDLAASHSRVRDALEHALQQRHALSLSEFEVLQRLAESSEGHLRMQELAEQVHLSQSALSRLVGRLEGSGLVARSICDDDRRGIWACITHAGSVAHRLAEPTQREVLATVASWPPA
jgi:DNA-binding MarR family transcriptional regulator